MEGIIGTLILGEARLVTELAYQIIEVGLQGFEPW